jgi:hypothetical protein
MYHSDGNTGPLRTLALIDLVRSLGYVPKQAEAKPQEVDWRLYPQDGSVRVEALVSGQWTPGRFFGFVQYGMLAVRLDSSAFMGEYRRDVVRLVSDGSDDLSHLKDEPPPPRVALIDEPPPPRPAIFEKLDEIGEMPPVGYNPPDDDGSQDDPSDADDEPDSDPAEELTFIAPNPHASPIRLPDLYDWSTAPAGSPVWVDIDGDDIVDAVFCRVTESGLVVAEIEGQEREFHPERVTYAGDAS